MPRSRPPSPLPDTSLEGQADFLHELASRSEEYQKALAPEVARSCKEKAGPPLLSVTTNRLLKRHAEQLRRHARSLEEAEAGWDKYVRLFD